MTTRIFLVGFMGAGKTTIGRLLADKLNWSFVDLDAEVERSEGASVAEIFASRGEDWFRSAESECLKVVSAPRRRVVSLGGGTYVNPRNRALVDSLGLSVYLEAPLDVLLERIGRSTHRPLASDKGRLERLFEERLSAYRMAGATIETAHRSPGEIVLEIMEVVGGV